MSQSNPKKPRLKKLNLDSKTAWRNILKDVDKKEIPVHILEKLVVYLIDGTEITVDVKTILESGLDPNELESHVNKRLTDLDQYIKNVDFFVDIEKVKKTIQPETDKILSKL